jgi:hypothetical protein
MKRIAYWFVLLLFSFTVFTATQPAKAQQGAEVLTSASCNATTHTLTVSVGNVSDGSAEIFAVIFNPFTFIGPFTQSGNGTVTFTITNPIFVSGMEVVAVLGDESDDIFTTCTEGDEDCFDEDDRLNPVCLYPEESFAVYCRADSIVIYAVNEGVGYFAFSITQEELDEYDDFPEHNILIEQAKGARLYKLTSGLYQVNRLKPDGKEYYFIFDGC